MTSRLSLAAALLITASAARAGLVIGTQETQGGKPSREAVIYVEGNKMASDDAGDSKRSFIWDGDARKITLVDRQQKTFQEMTPADVSGMKARMSKAMEEAKARMTPEQRKAFEQMMAEQKDQGPKKQEREVEYVPAAGGDRVIGHACKNYREVRAGKTIAETCFIPWSEGVVSRADFAPLERLEEFWRPMIEQTPGAQQERSFATELSRAPGVPAIRKSLGPDGKVEREERLTKLERTRVPGSRFAVPAGYTRAAKPPNAP